MLCCGRFKHPCNQAHNATVDAILEFGYFLHLCQAAGYQALKKYHDLEIWPWPTCRGILGDGIRNKKTIPTGSIFFLEFTNL